MSITGGALTLLILIVKPLIKDRLPKSAQYALWLVVLAALLVPVSKLVTIPANPVEFRPLSVAVEQNLKTSEEEKGYNTDIVASPLQEENTGKSITFYTSPVTAAFTFFSLFYPFGALFFLFCHVMGYEMFIGKLRRTRTLTDIAAPVRVYRSGAAAMPMLIGLFRPVIVLPDRDYAYDQLRCVLSHELTHLRRRDVFIKWLSVLAGAAHWFNPLVYIARRELARACELSCDEAVIRKLDDRGRKEYGNTLLSLAAQSRLPRAVVSTTMVEGKEDLKERLGAIMKSKKYTRSSILLSAALIAAAVLIACALGSGQSGKNSKIFFTSGEERVIASFGALASSDYADVTVKFSEATGFITEYMISVSNEGTGIEEKLIKVGETHTFAVSGYNATTVRAKASADRTGHAYATFEVSQAKSEAVSKIGIIPDEDMASGICYFISDVNIAAGTFNAEQVKWLSAERDADELSELGVDPGSLPNGFYLHNLGLGVKSYGISPNTLIFALDWNNNGQTYKTIDLAEFAAIVDGREEGGSLWRVALGGGAARQIAEQYLP
jgi:beta-lactamase regulating signal transducer with metallopeptidase domain